MFSYRTLGVSVLPRDLPGAGEAAGELDLPPEAGLRSARDGAVAFFGEDFCDEPTCGNDTCFEGTCPDPTCFEDTCAHHSCHEQTCADATAPPPPPTCEGITCDGISCDGNTCGDTCDTPMSCGVDSCAPDGSCPLSTACHDESDGCPDGTGGECPGDSGVDECPIGLTDDCGDATCEDDSGCLHSIPIKLETPGEPDDLARLHRELDDLPPPAPDDAG